MNIVILTGAGISAESGLATFRGSDGLWCGHRIEDVATPEAFARNPALVHEFYNLRRAQLKEVQPNAAHHALAELAAGWEGEFLLVTQNVDDLHDRAQSNSSPCRGEVRRGALLNSEADNAPHPNPPPYRGREYLLHMHGELKKVRCERCEEVHAWEEALSVETACPACSQKKYMRPHIVWFGEMPLEMDRITRALENCDLFLSIGTSGNVYPAAGFVQMARHNGRGAKCVELNLEPSLGQNLFHEHLYGPASQVVPEFVQSLLA